MGGLGESLPLSASFSCALFELRTLRGESGRVFASAGRAGPGGTGLWEASSSLLAFLTPRSSKGVYPRLQGPLGPLEYSELAFGKTARLSSGPRAESRGKKSPIPAPPCVESWASCTVLEPRSADLFCRSCSVDTQCRHRVSTA